MLNVQHLQHDEKIFFTSRVIHYGTSPQGDHNSGAYLFIPDGEAKEIPNGDRDVIRIQRGPLVSQIEILHEVYALQYQLTNIDGENLIGLEGEILDLFRFGRLYNSSGCYNEFKYE